MVKASSDDNCDSDTGLTFFSVSFSSSFDRLFLLFFLLLLLVLFLLLFFFSKHKNTKTMFTRILLCDAIELTRGGGVRFDTFSGEDTS